MNEKKFVELNKQSNVFVLLLYSVSFIFLQKFFSFAINQKTIVVKKYWSDCVCIVHNKRSIISRKSFYLSLREFREFFFFVEHRSERMASISLEIQVAIRFFTWTSNRQTGKKETSAHWLDSMKQLWNVSYGRNIERKPKKKTDPCFFLSHFIYTFHL